MRELFELTGFEKLAATEYVLFGKPPALPAITARLRRGIASTHPPRTHSWAELRLNRLPSYNEMRKLHRAVRKAWQDTDRLKPEERLLLAVADEVLGEKAASNRSPKDWQHVADQLRTEGYRSSLQPRALMLRHQRILRRGETSSNK